ncbi:hypothetical protein RDWZM_004239 [Blomia tropicalis]|uniref:Uncharacterized protein n=1 Tax=Blomia tropicalis TaxID=40697 RepID=A0A9Q0MHP7_BLOTA|nr:hypothetical protein RDWZM_004239 [Blomia tropicalis]
MKEEDNNKSISVDEPSSMTASIDSIVDLSATTVVDTNLDSPQSNFAIGQNESSPDSVIDDRSSTIQSSTEVLNISQQVFICSNNSNEVQNENIGSSSGIMVTIESDNNPTIPLLGQSSSTESCDVERTSDDDESRTNTLENVTTTTTTISDLIGDESTSITNNTSNATNSNNSSTTPQRYHHHRANFSLQRPHDSLNLFNSIRNTNSQQQTPRSRIQDFESSLSLYHVSCNEDGIPILSEFTKLDYLKKYANSLDDIGASSSEFDSDEERKLMNNGNKQRLPLEDFMRKIVFQINSTSDKVWSNLLLDFTKNFADYQVPFNGFASNDYDLLLDILNIALKSMESEQWDRRVFASRLLLNINELLNPDLIRTKVMPVLIRVLDDQLDLCSTDSTNLDECNRASTTALRFNLCYVLAHFAQRLGFCYFVPNIFPYFEKLFHGQQSSSSTDRSSSIAIDFALLDSMTILLSTVLHYNEVLSKKCQSSFMKQNVVSSHQNINDEDEVEDDQDDDEDDDEVDDDDEDADSFPTSTTSTNSPTVVNETSSSTTDSDHSLHNTPPDYRHLTVREVFDFIADHFIPLMKQLFNSLLDGIEYYRSLPSSSTQASSTNSGLDSNAIDCFLQWKDQNRSTNESIIQTLYGHYQTFVFFKLLLRDYLKKSSYNEFDDENHDGQLDEQEREAIRSMSEVMQTKFTVMDQWYHNYYSRLVKFIYSPVKQQCDSRFINHHNHFQQQQHQPNFRFIIENLKSEYQEQQSQSLASNSVSENCVQSSSISNETFKMVTDEEEEDVEEDEEDDGIEVDEDDIEDDKLVANIGETGTSKTLIDNCEQTKINLQQELSKSEDTSTINTITTTITTPKTIANSFIGKFQLTESKLNNNNSNGTIGLSSNRLNDWDRLRLAKFEDDHLIQHQQQQQNQNNHFQSSISNEIFGFFDYNMVSCKSALINSVPILFDLYYITKSNSEIAASSAKLCEEQATKTAVETSTTSLLFSSTSSITSTSTNPLSSTTLIGSNITGQTSDIVILQFIESLNLIILDSSTNIVIKMLNVFHKLISRLPNSIRFYSILVNVLQSSNVSILANFIGKFSEIFSMMIRPQRHLSRDDLSVSFNATERTFVEMAIESIVNAFLRSETFLSTKPNWRLYIEFLEVLLDISRLVSNRNQLIKRLIMPRLLLRFANTRHIPSRQAIIRCLLIIYLEQYAQYDYMKFNQSTASTIDENGDSNGKLNFDLFAWLDSNLRKSDKYQQRQCYIDIYAILLRLMFGSPMPQGQSMVQAPPNEASSFDHNLYLVDLMSICPKLHTVQFDQYNYHLLAELDRLHFVALLVSRNDILEKFTDISINDRVPTIRASAATVLNSIIWTMKCCTVLTNLNQSDCTAARLLTNYLTIELMERLFERVHQDRDRLVVAQLKRVFKLVDCVRQDLRLSHPIMEVETKTPPTEELLVIPKCAEPSLLNKFENDNEIIDEIHHLMDELLNIVQNECSEMVDNQLINDDPMITEYDDQGEGIENPDDPEIDVLMGEQINENHNNEMEHIDMTLQDSSGLETSLTTLSISTHTTDTITNVSANVNEQQIQHFPSPSSKNIDSISPRRGIIVISSMNELDLINNVSSSTTSNNGKKLANTTLTTVTDHGKSSNGRKKWKKSTITNTTNNDSVRSMNGPPDETGHHRKRSPSLLIHGSVKQGSSNKRITQCSPSMIPLVQIATPSNTNQRIRVQTTQQFVGQTAAATTIRTSNSNHKIGNQIQGSTSVNGIGRSTTMQNKQLLSNKSVRNQYELRPMDGSYFQTLPPPPPPQQTNLSQSLKPALLPTPGTSKLPIMFNKTSSSIVPNYGQQSQQNFVSPFFVSSAQQSYSNHHHQHGILHPQQQHYQPNSLSSHPVPLQSLTLLSSHQKQMKSSATIANNNSRRFSSSQSINQPRNQSSTNNNNNNNNVRLQSMTTGNNNNKNKKQAKINSNTSSIQSDSNANCVLTQSTNQSSNILSS